MTRPDRAVIVAIYQATFPRTPEWPEGPLPIRHGDVQADTANRAGYYPPRTARLLYGSAGRPRRWHKPLTTQAGDVELMGLEAVRLRDEPGASGLIAVHLRTTRERALDVVRALARRDGSLTAGFDPSQLVDGHAIVAAAVPYTLSFVTRQRRRFPRLYRHPKYMRWPNIDQWLWALASRTNGTDYPPDPHRLPTSRGLDRSDVECIPISADWCGVVLRDGLALIGRRADKGPSDPFYNRAELNARSIYLDALLIGILQLHGISELEDALAAALDHPPGSSLIDLEHRVTEFRHELWWQHLSAHGVANQLLGAYQRQHRLRDRFDQVLTEISDFNRLHREHEKRYVNNALVLFTLITVPVSLALALLQALGSHSPWTFGIVLVSSVVLTAALLMTRTSRVVLRSIRKRLSS